MAADLGNAHLRGILASLNEGVITTDETQTIVMANPAAARMFRTEDLLGASLETLIPKRFRKQHNRDVVAFGAGGVAQRQMGHRPDVTGVRADGEEFPIDATISLVEVGGLRLFTAVLRDMTEEREAERELYSNRAKLDAALASMNDCVFILDSKPELVDFNDAFVRFYRFKSREECVRCMDSYPEFLEVYAGDGEPAPYEQWIATRALRGETGANVEMGLRRKDTGERWYGSYSFAPIRGADGAIVGAVVTARDITAWKRAQADLQASHAALQRLVAVQDRIQEEERKRIARELHDELAQLLAMIGIQIRMASRALGDDPGRVALLLADAAATATDAITSTRRIINHLRPPALEELGLVEALRALALEFTRRSGVECDVRADDRAGDLAALHPDVAACLYRVAQESLNNVVKHAHAQRVRVSLSSVDGSRVMLSVRDDGVGIRPHDRGKPDSFGLPGMSERVRAVGGELSVSSEPEAGTTISAVVTRGRAA